MGAIDRDGAGVAVDEPGKEDSARDPCEHLCFGGRTTVGGGEDGTERQNKGYAGIKRFAEAGRFGPVAELDADIGALMRGFSASGGYDRDLSSGGEFSA